MYITNSSSAYECDVHHFWACLMRIARVRLFAILKCKQAAGLSGFHETDMKIQFFDMVHGNFNNSFDVIKNNI